MTVGGLEEAFEGLVLGKSLLDTGVRVEKNMVFAPVHTRGGWTNLLREVFGAQEKSQQTSDNNGQHREDEQAVLLTDPLHTHPHGVQRHGHRVSRPRASSYTSSSP